MHCYVLFKPQATLGYYVLVNYKEWFPSRFNASCINVFFLLSNQLLATWQQGCTEQCIVLELSRLNDNWQQREPIRLKLEPNNRKLIECNSLELWCSNRGNKRSFGNLKHCNVSVLSDDLSRIMLVLYLWFGICQSIPRYLNKWSPESALCCIAKSNQPTISLP